MIFLLIFVSSVLASYSNLVDPFIGIGGNGYGIGGDPPGATYPFGAVRISPDTADFDNSFVGWNHFGGYYYPDNIIRVFSHTHMVGSGALDYGNIAVLPVSQLPTNDFVTDYGFRSKFSHDKEEAHPGYYKVYLEDHQVWAEVTATTQCSGHRYTFPEGNQPMMILFPISHSLVREGSTAAEITIDPSKGLIKGWMLNKGDLSGRFGGVKTYFSAFLNPSLYSIVPETSGGWNDSVGLGFGSEYYSMQGTKHVGAFVHVEAKNNSRVIEMVMSISFISIDQALVNLKAQVTSSTTDTTDTSAIFSFDDIYSNTARVWEGYLSKIQVTGGSQDDRVKFYSALYHSFMAPTTWSEAGGLYLGVDGLVHSINSSLQLQYYTDMSLWDVHRTQFPLLGVLVPSTLHDIIVSLWMMALQAGDLPRWPLANNYTGCMIGQHADIVIAEAYVKGIIKESSMMESLYSYMKAGALDPSRSHNSRDAVEFYLKHGYVPVDQVRSGCSNTLAYAYDDSAIAQVAQGLGYEADYLLFKNSSENYKKVWNEEEGFMCPKDSEGKWDCPYLKINVFDSRYIEGDAWQWRWFVPQDIPGMIELNGGKERFVSALSEFFYMSENDPWNGLPNPYYWAGNEPDIMAVWMFTYANRPDLTQYYSRWLLEHKYSTSPDGLPGNDDYGTMSAWYVFGAMGFYPIAGSSRYVIGSPLFDSVLITTPSGSISIQTWNNSWENVYVQNVTLNGQVLQEPFVEHADLMGNNVQLVFWMGNSPSDWGCSA